MPNAAFSPVATIVVALLCLLSPITPASAQSSAGPPLGPKRTIAVGEIQAAGGYNYAENWDVSGGLEAMLSTGLTQSGRFIVVERGALKDLLNEQQMAGKGVSAGAAAPMPGRMTPAQYLVTGAVTEFGGQDKGGGLSIGGVGSGGLGGGLSLNRTGGKVTIDMRLVETASGRVLEAFRVSNPVGKTSLGFTSSYQGLSVGGNQFWRSPLGEATRRTLDLAVMRIGDILGRMPWQGQVVEFDGRSAIVNVGTDAGLKLGDRLRVERTGRILTDPATGQVLGDRRTYLGDLIVSEVEPLVATAVYYSAGTDIPRRGDLVVSPPPAP